MKALRITVMIMIMITTMIRGAASFFGAIFQVESSEI